MDNGWLEDDPFLLGWPIFRGYVSFRECIPNKQPSFLFHCSGVSLESKAHRNIDVFPYCVRWYTYNSQNRQGWTSRCMIFVSGWAEWIIHLSFLPHVWWNTITIWGCQSQQIEIKNLIAKTGKNLVEKATSMFKTTFKHTILTLPSGSNICVSTFFEDFIERKSNCGLFN